MDSDERMLALLTEIRDLVREELDEFRAANEKQAAALEESLQRQRGAVKVQRLAMILLAGLAFYLYWTLVSRPLS